MVRRTKERLRVIVPASILALMVGLLFVPAVGAYWGETSGNIPSYFDVAKGNYPWGIYSYASTPDPDMSCGQTMDGNAVGMGVYEEFVQTGVAKMYTDTRHPYASSVDHSGLFFEEVDWGWKFDPASYHVYMVTYGGMESGLYKFQPIAWYGNGYSTSFLDHLLVNSPHSSFTGIESDTAGCLTGYSQFQYNEYAPAPYAAMQGWCPQASPLRSQNLPYSGCYDYGTGDTWWIGN